MSQAELARRTGLSKATLSQLEAGAGNPTIDTLDAVAVALAVPLNDLLTPAGSTGVLHLPGTAAEQDAPTRELLRRISGGHSLEIWRLRLPERTSVDGVPHAPGTTEHLLVASGGLVAGPADDLRRLEPGDMLAFPGDAPHGYRTGEVPADVTVVIASPVIASPVIGSPVIA
ncbi:helix-turn-helix transcriptional regulator [Actinomadura barringtoniae]|uniref:Helix-turn-helix transcriptional regulator n=2 Tax=Actinomadura barringtoniae TaxID=1427535 RepID=A0A939PJ73_9ACTN|nr:helix-turn-helix transcriptional regulator [Actinomadura barringtoniae]